MRFDRRWIPLALLLSLLPVAGCAEGPTDPHSAEPPAGAHFAILDAPRGGDPHFFWLPPIVASEPEFSASFDPDQPAVVNRWTESSDPGSD